MQLKKSKKKSPSEVCFMWQPGESVFYLSYIYVYIYIYYLVISVCSAGSGDMGRSFNVSTSVRRTVRSRAQQAQGEQEPHENLSRTLMEWFPAEY